MSVRSLRKRLFLPALIAASVLVGLGCGVVNPGLLGGSGATGATPAEAGASGNIAILVVNDTPVTTQANVTVTKVNGAEMVLNIPVPANDHVTVVQNCEVDTVQVESASYAGPGGAVIIPAAVSPLQMGLTLQCGGVVAVSITGAPPGVFLNVQSF